jgi:nucleoid DNA-binding protein
MIKGEKELIQIAATKHNLPLQEVQKIVFSQFRLVSKTMSKGDMEEVRLPYFGTFKVKPKRIKTLRDAARKIADSKRGDATSKS